MIAIVERVAASETGPGPVIVRAVLSTVTMRGTSLIWDLGTCTLNRPTQA